LHINVAIIVGGDIVERGCKHLTQVTVSPPFHHFTRWLDIENETQETAPKIIEKFGLYQYGMTWHNMQQVLASLLPPEKVVTNHSF
jgi:hypothetical protein